MQFADWSRFYLCVFQISTDSSWESLKASSVEVKMAAFVAKQMVGNKLSAVKGNNILIKLGFALYIILSIVKCSSSV